jgi:hypothetical protein
VFLNYYYFFFFFYSCTTATIGTTTITSNSASEGEGTPKTNYKLWSFKFRSFGGRKERTAPKLVLLPALGFGIMHTHTHKVWLQYKIYTRWCNPTYTCFPCTWVWRLAFRLCTLVCFWACSHVMNSPCNSFGRKRREFKKKTPQSKRIFFFFFFSTCHRWRAHKRGSFCNTATSAVYRNHCPLRFAIPFDVYRRSIWHLSSFRPKFVVVPFDIHCCSIQRSSSFRLKSVVICSCGFVHSAPSVHQCLSTNIHSSMFVRHRSSLSTHHIFQTIHYVRTL